MKKYISFLSFILCLPFFMVSCEEVELGDDFLSKPPGGDITIDTVYANLENANRALTAAYATLPYSLPWGWSLHQSVMYMDNLESLTDLASSYVPYGGPINAYYSGAYAPSMDYQGDSNGKYLRYGFKKAKPWLGIRRAYTFINNIDRVPDADQETKDRLKGEAMMVAAVHYNDLFRNYTGVPWVNKNFAPTDDTFSPRLTAEATMDSIVGLIDRAAKLLPWQVNDISNNEGRFTRAAAKALKIRVLLFGASPVLNSDTPYREGEASDKKLCWMGGYDVSRWQDVVTACEDFFNELQANGGYQLEDTGNPREDFTRGYLRRGSKELLISTRNSYRFRNLFFGQYSRFGAARPTQELVDLYPMKSGKSITDPTSGYDPSNPYINRDPRLYETVIVNGDAYRGRTAELFNGGREKRRGLIAATGYMQRKFYLDGNRATSQFSVIQWPYLRLSEVYLSYAEALNEVNGGPTALAYEYLNKTRERVDVGPAPTGLTLETFRKEVLDERARELAYEDVRLFDIIRWKIPFIQPHMVKLQGSTSGITNIEYFEVEPRRVWVDQWDPKWYFCGFPPDEINKGYGLIQNPGWE
ncbi:RagB/SusD family nutrient uptake outer membrane protein [Gaetbulibacter saemankumensis]|uniref:RagB/SusD family nutrient uptake outer membrane protein n=1 Tax=Gaetbulibacter saemankumensis TaxID=311208 RepID=UPI0003FEA481|nr:RagB/SusD family nutrient uptake outer membrane protein [Gaetbulibacter saemankumensis]